MTKPKRFYLTDVEVAKLKAEYKRTDRFPNPYERGFFHFLIEALINLGTNQAHPLPRVFDEVVKLMSDPTTRFANTTVWERFATANDEDISTRIEKNIATLKRLEGIAPWGRRLADVGDKVLGQNKSLVEMFELQGVRHVRLTTGRASALKRPSSAKK